MATMFVNVVGCAMIVACRPLSDREQPTDKMEEVAQTCRLSPADFRCNLYGFLLTINPAPSESGTSFSGFLILMCSAWKLPSIIKPRMKRFLLKQNVSSFQIFMSIDLPIFVLFPIIGEVDPGLCAQSAERSHRPGLGIFVYTIPKTEPLSSNQSSPQSTDP